MKLNPENTEAHYMHGKIFLKEKKYKEAETKVQEAIELQKKNKQQVKSGSYFLLGQSQEL